MGGVKNEIQIALLCSGGQTDSRTRTLPLYNDNRCLGHASQSDTFHHQTETAPGSRCHCAHTGIGRADNHVHCRNFILGRDNDQTEFFTLRGEIFHNRGDRCHRISRDKFTTGGNRADGHCFVAVEQHPSDITDRCQFFLICTKFQRIFVTGFCGVNILNRGFPAKEFG